MDFGRWVNKQAKEIQESYKKEETKKGLEEESFAEEWDSDGDLYSDIYAIPGISLEEASGFTREKQDDDKDELTSLMRLDDDYDIVDQPGCGFVQGVSQDEYNNRFKEWMTI